MTESNKAVRQEDGLSYHEKSLIVTIFSDLFIYAVYSLIVFQRFQRGDYDLEGTFRFWSGAILLLIAVQIAFTIAMHILFNIVHTIITREEEDPSFTDERDKLIEMKSTRDTFIVFGIGFLLAMLAMALGLPPVMMFVTIFIALIVAGIAGSITKLYYYWRGV
jgi:uncharacterized membrane protein